MLRIPLIHCLAPALFAAACSAPASAPSAARTDGPFVVPDFAGGYFRFDASEYRHGASAPLSLPLGAGPPLASAMDQASAWACVAYRHQLAAIFQLAGEVAWHPVDWAGEVPAIAIGDERLGAALGTRARMIELASGALLWEDDCAAWMREVGADRLHGVVPIGAERFIAVTSRRPRVLGADGAGAVHRVDRSRGRWRNESSTLVPMLTHVQALTNVGTTLYLAGVKESYQTGAGASRGRAFANLVVVRYDAADARLQEAVLEREHERARSIQGFLALRDPDTRDDRIALLLETGEIRVYRVPARGAATSSLFEITLPGTRSIAWTGPRTLAALGPGSLELLDLP